MIDVRIPRKKDRTGIMTCVTKQVDHYAEAIESFLNDSVEMVELRLIVAIA
ncbi:MAG: hypothetical protein O3C43_22560 [Verrucomicrobia bacterium]|nr:hypothetical protein [Verrucomicrobiota bacterium]MDA1069274.1 hypothetical protein [Verrucomicrobiota bacterium]